ncbi:Major facilitator superfamily [Macrophomina phaseolina MS6]|uniref:Major facilitator superfamily n=1 Tax=Macrophomina phaseolina (strain MS6) TaxID=1126212 RepID=K2R4X7_MACPH|nr:Major facilitator superfamily [Macrophomina phaseolina MS6]
MQPQMEAKPEMASTAAGNADIKAIADDIGIAAIAEVGEVEDFTADEERAVRWKIDLHLMPMLMITYLVQYLDKSSISYSALWGMRQDVGLHGNQYSWLTTIFYIGYLLAEFPMNALFQRLHITKVCGVIIGLWGTVLLCMAACDDFAGLMATRFFLGALESGVSPCFVLLTSMFYRRSEQPLRTALWFSMNGMSQIIGGPIAYGVGYIHNALPAWKFPFLIFGSITVAWSIVFFFCAPPNPVKARWLCPHERTIAVARLASNNTGLDTRTFKAYQAREALLDHKVWLLFLFTIASNIPNGGITAFGPLIIEGFGYSTLGTTLLGMPIGATQILALWISGWAAGKFSGTRIALMLGGIVVALTGTVMMYAIPEHNKLGRLFGYYLLPGFSATYVLSLGMIQANVAGRTKRSVVTAGLFVAYCVGNLAGPQLFLSSCDPGTRDEVYGQSDREVGRGQIEQGLSDLTDRENTHFRYAL